MVRMLIIVIIWSLFLTAPEEVMADSNLVLVSDDTTAPDNNIEKIVYEISTLALQRRLKSVAQKNVDSLLLADILELNLEARTHAQKKEFVYANFILQEINELLPMLNISTQPVKIVDLSDLPATDSLKTLNWNYEVAGGIDFWNQKFEMNFGESDTTMSEGASNPFLGFSVELDYGIPQQTSLQTNFALKDSRDYLTASTTLSFNRKIRTDKSLEIENFTDWTNYKQDTFLSYFQNSLSTSFRFKSSHHIRYLCNFEFRLHDYLHEEEYNASYFHNQLRFKASFTSRKGNNLGAGLKFVNRNYPHYNFKNYNKTRFDLSGDYILHPRMKIYVRNEIISKNYLTTSTDTLYQSDYIEKFLYADFRFNFTTDFYLTFNNLFRLQKYKNQLSYLRDNFENEIQGSFNYHFDSGLTTKIGTVYTINLHQGEASDEDIPPESEDYYAYGGTFSVEYFLARGLMLNLTATHQIRRYPNAEDVSDFSLFSDRNMNSLFLFFAWTISPAYQLNMFANYDTDHDREVEHSDSKNTVFTLEFTRKF